MFRGHPVDQCHLFHSLAARNVSYGSQEWYDLELTQCRLSERPAFEQDCRGRRVCTWSLHCTLFRGALSLPRAPPLPWPPAEERPWLPEHPLLQSPRLPDSTPQFRGHQQQEQAAHTWSPCFGQRENENISLCCQALSPTTSQSVDFPQIFPQRQRPGAEGNGNAARLSFLLLLLWAVYRKVAAGMSVSQR